MKTGDVARVILESAHLTIPCTGQLIHITGGVGKRTVLRLIAGFYQHQGALVTPPHKRIILVERYPVLFSGTLLENLRFGRQGHKQVLDDNVCWTVAESAGLCKECVGNVDFIVKSNTHRDQFTTKDRTAMGLAQALLAEPGLLCVDHLGDTAGATYVIEVVAPLLRKYKQGGLQGVLCDSPFASDFEIPQFLPTVIWSTLVHSLHIQADQTMLVNNGQLSVEMSV